MSLPACFGSLRNVQYPQKSRHIWVKGIKILGEKVTIRPLPRRRSAAAAAQISAVATAPAEASNNASVSAKRLPSKALDITSSNVIPLTCPRVDLPEEVEPIKLTPPCHQVTRECSLCSS